ncbi:hypothetical protein [Dyadobacter sp. 676]|uniref:Glycosyltransferase RgtA/B/C/D-like domain-containing protein n=1 Tax=Dyadobacter sp. 676 TaxID=3088362 RepID=A0AAU8FP74_9BACT
MQKANIKIEIINWSAGDTDMLPVFLIEILVIFFGISRVLSRVDWSLRGVKYPVSFGITISGAACLYYLSLVTSFRIEPILAFFSGCFGTFTLTALLKKKDSPESVSKRLSASNLLIFSIGILVLTLRFNKHLHRWGDWDAYAIWTHHAKFLFYPEYWKTMFTQKLASTHPDYPLMLPSIIALTWRNVNLITPIVPMAISYFTFLSISATIFLSLNQHRRLFFSILSLLIFALDSKYLNIAASQYADTMLAFFILIAFVLYKQIDDKRTYNIAILLGFVAGSAAWVKNEGILFFLIFSATLCYFKFKQPHVIVKYILGALVPVLIVIHFKITLAPPNDLVHSNRGEDILKMIADPARYLLIVKHFVITSASYYWILFVLFLALLMHKTAFSNSFPFIVISLILCGYFVIYLTTPNDLNWHLGASLDRLLHHLFPSCIYLFLFRLSSVSNIRQALGGSEPRTGFANADRST